MPFRDGSAASFYDPELNWHTVFSPRFAVHYPDGAGSLGLRISRIAEDVLDDVTELLEFSPSGRIEIVLSDASDRANGSAQVAPKNIIRIFLSVPTELSGLSSFDDWLRLLMVHELAHIVDIDHTRGFNRLLRSIFGKYISPNGFTPQFLSEGVAVYAETLLTKTGRGRSTYVDGLLRMAALEGRLLSIDRANILYGDWPGPSVAYYYGGRFHLWLASRFGRKAVAALHNFNAAMPLPYLYFPAALSAFGQSLPSLWDEWLAELERDALRIKHAISAHGVTSSRAITTHGRNITGATYSPEGSFVIYSRTSPVDGSTVRRINRDGSGDRHLVLRAYSPRFSFSPDGSGFYYSQNAINRRFNDYADLYRYNLNSDTVAKLVDSRFAASGPDAPALRASDPDVAPDGKELLFVQGGMHERWLSTADLSQIESSDDGDILFVPIKRLVHPGTGTWFGGPRYSPDGRSIAVSATVIGGNRDIWLLDAKTGEIQKRLAEDTAQDANPAWSAGGDYLLYDSDMDGIRNIYAYSLKNGKHLRVTRVIGGAYQPDVSNDGKWVLFRNTSGTGFDIHEVPFAPSTWEVVSRIDDTGDTRSDTARPAPTTAPNSTTEVGSHEHTETYSVWRTLLPFQDNWNLMPALFQLNGDTHLRLTTFGQDVLARHTYALSVGASEHGEHFNYSMGYVNDVYYPTFSVSGFATAEAFPHGDGFSVQRRRGGAVGMSLPVRRRHHLGLSYVFENRDQWRGVRARNLSDNGNFSRIGASYSYGDSVVFQRSVSPEHGIGASVGLTVYSRVFGASFDETILGINLRRYQNIPWFDNHVLSLRIYSALPFGPDYGERFILGGVSGSSFFRGQTERVYGLRGFDFNLDERRPGAGLGVAYLEYRMPVWHIERGLFTLPVYLKRFYAVAFADIGNTFDVASSGDPLRVFDAALGAARRSSGAVGGELRAVISLGWSFPLVLRLGVAVPTLRGGRVDKSAWEQQPVVYGALGT